MNRIASKVVSLVASVAFALVCQSALATIVNVDFNGQNDSDSLGPTYSGASAAGAGTIWNGVTVDSRPTNYDLTITASGLTDDAGAATSVALQFMHVGGDRNQSGGNPLWMDYLGANFGAGGQAPFTISGLGAATSANLYFYHLFDHGGAAPFVATIGGTPVAISPTAIFDSGNTAFYQNVPVSGGSLSGILGPGGAVSLVNGMSIQFVQPTPAPEPGSLALAACGLAMVTLKRRRALSRA